MRHANVRNDRKYDTLFVLVVEGVTHAVIECDLCVSASIIILLSVDPLSQTRKCQGDWCCTVAWLCSVHQTGEDMPSFPANHSEGADSISFGRQPIKRLQIAMYVNESDGGPDDSLAVSWLVADSSCCSLPSDRPVADHYSVYTHSQSGQGGGCQLL